jgi:hypothetical protein
MNTLRIVLTAALAALIVAGCGGGTGGTGVTNGGPTNAVSIGVMTKGSVIVNGVHFDDTNAQITVDDSPTTSAALQSGMVVKVRGQINDDSLTGIAQAVKAEAEVRGTVNTHNASTVPPTFTVIGQTVFVDDLTVFANFGTPAPTPSAAVGALVDGTSVVEVHGLRDAAGNIHASRVELIATPVAGTNELRGTVANVTGTSFTLQNGTANVSVSYAANVVVPAGATLANGALVEIHGAFNGTTFTATRVDIEDLEDAQFQHAAGEEFEVEGQVSGCGTNNPCTSFSVGNQAVQTNPSTRFENGAATDLADGVRIEAEGHQFTGNTLVAEKITFKRTRLILAGQVTAVTGTIPPGPGTIMVLGQTVQVTTLTEVNATGGITTTDFVEVRGFIDTTGSIVAERLDDNAGGGNKDSVQARVTAKVGNVLTLLVGASTINADLTNATQFSDTNEQPITLGAFLAAVTPAPAPGGTLVKVKGTFSAGTIAVGEAELEN